jgi:glycosyltransferase involved in cell wall biosynthesis
LNKIRQDDDLVTVFIAAYNMPDYTRKTLDSILLQSYRPIEIVLIDDHSPTSLESFFSDFFKEIKDKGIIPKFYRNNENLGPYFTLQSGLRKVVGKYIVLLNHDDWFTDRDFLKTSLMHMNEVSDCFAVVRNSKIEGHELTTFTHNFSSDPIQLDGNVYLNKYLFKKIHPAYSGVLMNFNELKNLNYEQLFISKAESNTLGIIPDESFVMLSLLAERGSVIVSNQIASVRGNPPGSYSKTAEWRKEWVLGVFFPLYKLLLYFIRERSAKGAIGVFRAIIRFRRVKFSQIFFSIRRDGFRPYIILLLINTFYSVIIDCIESPRRNIVALLPDFLYKKLVYCRNKLRARAGNFE